MQKNDLPTWLLESENYSAIKDNDAFIDKTSKSMLSVLSRFRHSFDGISKNGANASLKLITSFIFIILVSVSKNFVFVLIMIAFLLSKIAFMRAEEIKAVFKAVFPALIVALIILVPAAVLGSPRTLVIVVTKVFCDISIVMIMSVRTPFNKITSAMKAFHIPNVFIFTLDTTLKYIRVLGEICYNMITALKIRSIGKNSEKGKSLSGIMGTAFIKSREMAEENISAMECRGFSGEYVVSRDKSFGKYDIILIIEFVLIVSLFVYFEVTL